MNVRTKRLAALDKKFVWHPFTQMKEWCEGEPLIIEKGQGNTLVDSEGRRYLDGVSSLWCNVHGHRVPEIDRELRRQLRRIAHTTFLGLTHGPAVELAEKLVAMAPRGLTKVFYSDSGSAAVEVALKMAYQYWQLKGRPEKRMFLKLKNAYHGDTLGSVSVGGIDLFHEIFKPLLFKTYGVDAPYRYRDSFLGTEADYAAFCASKVEAVLKKKHGEIAALVVEPLMQGAAGMLDQPRGYLSRLRALTKKYGVLLIADEVATGFGRTGRMFACEHENVSPDLLCLAKGITGGYLPLSATLATDEIYNAFLGRYDEFRAFFHGHTYSANPLACAAALGNLKAFHGRKTMTKLKKSVRIFSEELWYLRGLPHVGDIRQKGLMAGIELVRDKRSKQAYPPAEKRGYAVIALAREQGVMIRPLGNVVVLMPPLSITPKEIRFLVRTVLKCIREATGS